MKEIDYYIERVKQGDVTGGDEGTKAYPFIEEGVILVNKSEMDFAELQERIRKCKSLGINIPEYLDYKISGDYRDWILEELAPGEQFAKLVNNDNGQNVINDIPYEHIEKYIRDSYLLGINGIGVEPRRRNIFYDKEKGFTTIDVATLSDDEVKQDSLYNAYYFFLMYSRVLLVKFSEDNRGKAIEQKTILNMIKAFRNVYPHFEKYSRFIYRKDSVYSKTLKDTGYDLTLNDEEYAQFISLINEFINNEIKRIIKNPDNLLINCNMIELLSSSIKYCPQFTLFEIKDKKSVYSPEYYSLEEYVKRNVLNRIKTLFLNNPDNNNLEKAYFCIRKQELNPLRKYDADYIKNQIEEEIKNIKNEKIKHSK